MSPLPRPVLPSAHRLARARRRLARRHLPVGLRRRLPGGTGPARPAALAAAIGVALAGCGGATVSSAGGGTSASPSGGAASGRPCGRFSLAVSPWVGYAANAAVIAELATTRLGCTVEKKDLQEEVSWQGLGTGEVDAIVENWGHEDLKQKYVVEQKTAVEAGPTGGRGVIGWYVPPWMKQKYPDITDYRRLDAYAPLFRTSESGGKGQLLDGDPSFVTADEALVKNLGLDFKVVYAGSEAALITAFRKAEADKTPLLGYFYSPQWLMSEVPLVKVDLPPRTPGCDDDPAKVACDYPAYTLDKVLSKRFADSGSPAADLVRRFSWSNGDQDVVARYIAEDKMSPEAAAKKWIAANPTKVAAWLG